ncbi:hypothetical protein EPA93_29030 [Ktedonosporobacter rubrisoli]|uniref:HAD family hydrolase n=1 Tax=Ktedonosporobacter rubrisoli TaxID=2509675 RepID=A0A4P6JXQ8_KTERU|nr:hypothetical protein [Ktedonosporobacter rubrisoli]QBD79806.1 hypothetical protein EPA93_29030 [Ktedonosporobacter rubrisoli]
MYFAIDIDGTIAWRDTPTVARLCNERLQLGIAPERLADPELLYTDFLQFAEVQAYRESVSPEQFRGEFGWIDLDPQALLAKRTMNGAIPAIERLASLGSVAYYTARYSPRWPEKSEAMAQATRQWLKNCGFPGADQVVFCDGPADKLHRLAALIEEEPQQVVFIDDLYEKIVKAFLKLSEQQIALTRDYLTLVAFEPEALPEQSHGLRIVELQSWRHIDKLTELLDKPRKDACYDNDTVQIMDSRR